MDCHSVARQHEPFQSTDASEYTAGIQQATSTGFPDRTSKGPVLRRKTRGCTIWRKIFLQRLDINVCRGDGHNTKKRQITRVWAKRRPAVSCVDWRRR